METRAQEAFYLMSEMGQQYPSVMGMPLSARHMMVQAKVVLDERVRKRQEAESRKARGRMPRRGRR
jgi:hypothetical protein